MTGASLRLGPGNYVRRGGRRGGLMVRALLPGLRGLGLSPGWEHCAVFLDKTL